MKSNLIGVLNYTTSNSSSVISALDAVGVKYLLSKNFKDLMQCNKIIIPGVGNMECFLEENPIKFFKKQVFEHINNGGLIYGICLGMQLLLDHSSEGDIKTLGFIKGEVISLKSQFVHELNVGYNKVITVDNSEITRDLFFNIDMNSKFYFLHKYFCTNIHSKYIHASSDFKNNTITALIYHHNILATQFHPELSGEAGLKFLKNFSSINIK